MRTSLTIDEETEALVKEAATAQNRTISGQLRHLIKTHPEMIGWKIFKEHPKFKEAIAKSGPVTLGS